MHALFFENALAVTDDVENASRFKAQL